MITRGPGPGGSDAPGADEPTASYRWWLKLQIGLGLVGAAVWLAGAILGQDFVAGTGLGLLLGALVLGLGRRSARELEGVE